MNRWYYMTNGTQRGPVSDTELRDLAEEGKLHPSSRVWKKGMRDWVPASKVKGLFSEELPPRLSGGDAPPRPLKKAFGKVPAWVWYAGIPSVGLAFSLAIILVAVLTMTLSGDSPRQRLLGTWEIFEGGHKHIMVFSSDGTMEVPSIDTETNREEMGFLRRLRYKFDGDHELVLIHTEVSAIRFNKNFPDGRMKVRAGDELIRMRVDFPSKDEMIITNLDGKKSVFQRAR
jgi:hypothetical protein